MIYTLKNLIDILFVLLCLGFMGFIFVLPFEVFSTKVISVEIKTYDDFLNLPVFYWVGIVLSIITYILFLIGLNYLRKTTNRIIRDSFYEIEIIHNLKRSGLFFILSAIVLSTTYLIVWILEAYSGSIKLILGTNVIIPLFLCIVGLFFILQSKVLDQARLFKEDIDLTV